MSNEKIKDILPLSTKVLYGVAEFGISLMTSALQFFLIFFYTDVLKYNPALVGTALLVGKLSWDAFNDPLFGYLSDRVNTRFGRRRPFMLLGAIPFGLSVWVMFSVPTGLTGAAAFFVVIGSFLFFDTFHTLVSVPYFAMTPELSRDYDERTSITAVRKIFGVTGYIAGAVLTTLVAGVFKNNFGLDEKAAYSAMGAVFGIIVTLTTLVTAFTVRERSRESAKPSEIPLLKAITIILKNRPFMRLMAAFLVSSFSFTVMTGLFAYYMKYQLNMHTQLPLVLFIMMGTLALFLFFWKWVADRINKGPAYALGLLIACVAISTTFFLPYGPSKLIYIIAFVVGFGFSSQYVFPWSMLPDCIEYDERETNERREGVYYGVWAIIVKLTSALGIAVIGWSLSLSGYIAPVHGEVIAQSEQVRLAIRLFFGPIPAIFMVLSLPLLIWFPITRKSHNALLDELDKRKL
jgi:GPH family glycoside/pentoside/hexuronide:cation symporter